MNNAQEMGMTKDRESDNKSLPEREKSKKYSKDDIIVSSGTDDDNNGSPYLIKPSGTKRVTSADGFIASSRRPKQIIVLPSTKKRVVSPPPIHNKSEFQMLLRPTMSADAIALKKRNMK